MAGAWMFSLGPAAGLCLYTLAGLGAPSDLAAQNHPSVELSNGELSLILHLPDEERGFYRGTRFEWGGVFGGLTYRGHRFFEPWVVPHDPLRHDGIAGPMQEFVIDGVDYSGQGFAEAAPGETFVKIGVGVLRRPDDEPYRFARLYEIVDRGENTVDVRPDAAEFVQRVADSRSGYGYRYAKTVRLEASEPVLVLEYTLRNEGERAIVGSVYNHNFTLIDSDPPGPQLVVEYPFDLNVTQARNPEVLVVDGPRFTLSREMSQGESVRFEFDGFADGPNDHEFRVENRRTGAGMRVVGDRPLSHLVFWSVPAVISPEAYIRLRVEPGEEFRWSTRYTFYTFDVASRE